ncbi:NAD-dependent epimerase/dehydratase family protein [Sphingomonas sp.]|uniref:NAD-dependent epimerase/dehydratase family protein n=1 Tax=Sphingomonas sp. TaxID=28214 RepID=UPI002D803F10|nr:NAD-dependent epimerase/dehydratase family protein [Sphingomonas sp.]HEU0043513.1 NAD-dependent epimerase/dehydratase family protein [Sphingomonas sp.]
MSLAGRHIVVTGAGGFVGGLLVDRLLAEPAFAGARITVNDLRLGDYPARVRMVAGDLAEPAVRANLLEGGCALLYHIGGVLGGAAEADPALARRVNVDATLALLEAVRDDTDPPRVVFASSVAVFSPPWPAHIDDDTRLNPTMIYGAQKAMAEIAVEQMSARRWIDGLALRLPGIVVKPGADARMKSAFLNRLFEVFSAGDDLTLPVSADGTTWLLSAPACIDALIHAGTLAPERIGARRALNLPCQTVRFADLVRALHARWPNSRTTVSYAPDPALEAQFGRQPPLMTALANSLGFHHDGDVTTLVARAL